MHCASCAKLIEGAVMEMDGIGKAAVSYQKEAAEIGFDTSKTSKSAIIKTVNDLGYEASEADVSDAGESEGKGLLNKLFGRK